MSDDRPRRAARDSARAGSVVEAAAAQVPEPAAPADGPVAHMVSPAAPRRDAPSVEPPAIVTDAPGVPRVAPATMATDDGWGALTEAQAVVARACEDIAVVVADIARSGIAAGTDAALALLGARTLAEAVEINAGLAQRGFGAMVAGSGRLSEIGVVAMTQASQPLLAQWSALWSAAALTGAGKGQFLR
jgi:hypothetical protein